MKTGIFIKKVNHGYSHPKCYLKSMGGCSSTISREHYISENLINKIERIKNTINVSGLSWLPKNQTKAIGKKALTAKILCSYHNSKLSVLDTEIGVFLDCIREIDRRFTGDNHTGLRHEINGSILEQWIIKTLIGMIESNQIVQKCVSVTPSTPTPKSRQGLSELDFYFQIV